MRKRSRVGFGVLSCVAVLLAGCAVATDERNSFAECDGAANEAPARTTAPRRAVKTAGAVGADRAERNFEVSGERKMAYRTDLVLQCQDVPKAVRSAGEIARRYHGYVAESDNLSIRVKIPVEEADAALTELEALGKVTDRKITAQDVTDQYVDTQVRIDNLRKLQEKLTQLLSRAKNVEETLKVERELSRVTTDLERYEATMKNLALRVAMVDMSLRFHAVMAPAAPGPMVPIPWVGELGTEISRRDFLLNQSDDVPFKVDIPAGFAVLFSNDSTLYAVNSEDVVLKLSQRLNFRDADAPFYRALVERALFSQNGYRKTASETITANRREFVTVSGERQLGDAPVRYWVALNIHDKGWFGRNEIVAAVELWGKPEAVQKVDTKALLESVRF